MKKSGLKQLMGALAAVILVVPAYTARAAQDLSDTEMERALVNSGFKMRHGTSAEQRAQIRRLPSDEFQEVKQNGTTYYVYASKRDNRLYVGDHWALQAYQGFVRNRELRKQGAFVFEVRPSDKANNKTIDIWPGYPPFRSF
jgi:hypothetical protein